VGGALGMFRALCFGGGIGARLRQLNVIVGLTIVFAYGNYALIEAPSRRKIEKFSAGAI
jgi:hypothetical protein